MSSNHRKKFSLEFDGLEELVEQFDELGVDIIPVANKALEATHAYITPKIHDKVQKSSLPAKGKYSTADRKHSESQIIDDVNIEWDRYVGKVDIGFSLDKSIVPIFLIHGVDSGKHKMAPARGLKSTIYGKKTQEEIAEIQEEIFVTELEKVMNGGK